MSLTAFRGAQIFDGETLHDGCALLVRDGCFEGIMATADLPDGCDAHHLDGGVLSPGFVDLQVNGGGGVMLNDDPSVETLKVMAKAHRSLEVTGFLPTLITDTRARSQAAIDAVAEAINQGVEGIIGLHLEGPHLSIARKGAHDGDLIRPMDDADLAMILDAAKRLPNVKMTVAPENVTEAQVAAMAEAGVIVSLGHTDADFDTCQRWIDAGATCVTHLYNAMSQLGNREPGLVGAALSNGAVSAGLIADGIHVHSAAIKTALRAKQGPRQVFLVSDAMAVAGSDATEFTLNNRQILRRDGRLTLADGTLAGADLDLTQAVRVLVQQVGVDLAQALAMATTIPAGLLRDDQGLGRFTKGKKIRPVWLDRTLHLRDLP
ncbi:N-acetylglucosamine-6-phosphate deacetylase [Thalassobius sp. I31.1]|uniref:N-acetylglucosamine-6-phosphate deacetylase n=1 Tax=Thalassobius sp. I31.1 TaxID=2109912 RepID=UPI000D19EC75|nr:N-acetylglucosamine-6-phosphate deacetylase [Thalassobius sp. I31.1]